MKICSAKNRSPLRLLAGLSLLVLAGCFQPVDLGETFIEEGTAHLKVVNESEDHAYILEGLELRNAQGEVEQSWVELDLEVGDKPWEVHTETSGSCTLWYRVKDTEISSTAIGVYPAYPPVEIALNRSHEFSFKGEALEVTQQDIDEDGLPDIWETEHGFDPEDKTDGGLVYVSPQGQDEAPGNGTKDHPYLTLAKAVDKAGRGLLVNGTDDSARTVVVLGTLTWANGGNRPNNPEYKGRDDSVFYLGKTRNPVTIKGEGPDNNRGTLTAENSGNKRVLYLGPGARVSFRDMVITGGKGIGGGIYASGADLTLGPGTAVTENNKTDKLGDLIGILGGGIYLERGTLIMEGDSSVSDNMASGCAGLKLASATLFMYGGKITKNCSTGGAGGLGAENSTIEMSAGAEISENTAGAPTVAAGSAGGGATISFSKLTMHTGSRITKNTIYAGYGGGGVYVAGESTLIMEEGSEISGNKNTIYKTDTYDYEDSGRGGGVSVVFRSSLIMEGGIIAGNTAGRIGGGIFLWDGGTTFDMRGGTVYGNTDADNKNEATTGDKAQTTRHGHAIYDGRPGVSKIDYDNDVTKADFSQ